MRHKPANLPVICAETKQQVCRVPGAVYGAKRTENVSLLTKSDGAAEAACSAPPDDRIYTLVLHAVLTRFRHFKVSRHQFLLACAMTALSASVARHMM